MSCLAACVFLLIGNKSTAQVPGAKHVVVIGIDGLSPDGIRKATTPHFHQLMKAGASTLHARAVMPTVSSPNWASMIMGAGPEQHGVTTNGWDPANAEITPTAMGPGGMFPTIFGLLRSQRPTAKIGCFHDWDGFGRLLNEKPLMSLSTRRGPYKPPSGPSHT